MAESRVNAAIALSAMDADDIGNNFDQFTEKDYDNSVFGRNLGELNWEPPAPPPQRRLLVQAICAARQQRLSCFPIAIDPPLAGIARQEDSTDFSSPAA